MQLKDELESANESLLQCRSQSTEAAARTVDTEARIYAMKKENQLLREKLSESSSKWAGISADLLKQGEPLKRANVTFPMPKSIKHYAVQMVTLPKLEFLNHFNYRLPLDVSADDVLLVYSSEKALPDGFDPASNPFTRMESAQAVKNCDVVHLLMTNHHDSKQCIALVPQWESYHIHKFARIDFHKSVDEKRANSSLPLVPVHRYTRDDGTGGRVPTLPTIRKSWNVLTSYMQQLPKSIETLRPLLARIAVNNTVTVMVTNFGQAELLLNFDCSAKARNLSVSNILVVALDTLTRDLASSMGYAVFCDEAMFGQMPMIDGKLGPKEARTGAFMAKAQAVHMVSLLEYDVLYQDVDVIWYQDPLSFFLNATGPYASHDAVFNDDGARLKQFMTFFANAGYYFIRSNIRTRGLLNRWINAADLIIEYGCDQTVLNIVLAESRSLFGLDVAVISREETTFLSGYHYHIENPIANPVQQMMVQQYRSRNRTGRMLETNISDAPIQPYVLHMHFTKSKDIKRHFFSQIGEWRVHEQCLIPNAAKVISASQKQQCCVAEPPPITCFYRNRPSAIPCHDSLPVPQSMSQTSMWEKGS
jgi:Nucleotide-diphospho-sugar transferase